MNMKLLAKPMLFAAAFIWGSSFFIMKNQHKSRLFIRHAEFFKQNLDRCGIQH